MWTIYKKQRKNPKILRNRRFTIYYQNELDKAYFQHDLAYGNITNLTRRTASDTILRNKAFNIAKKTSGFFGKKTSGRTVQNKNISNKQ